MARGGKRSRPAHPARQQQPARARPGQPVVPDELAAVFTIEGYSGPTPHHSMIAGYQQAIPHGGERLMALVESEAAHRHEMDRKNLNANFAAHVIGQILAFLLALAVIGAGAWLIDGGHDVAGYATLLVGGGSLIAAVWNSVRTKSEPTG